MGSGMAFDPLDPQRDDVYDAEAAVFPREIERFLTLPELQSITDELLAARWFRSRFPKVKRIAIKDGRGGQWSRSGDGCVHLLRKSRVRDVLVHEIVHQVVPPGTEWHGAVFVGMLLYFVGRLYDPKTKAKLRRALKRGGAVWDKRIARFGDLSRNGNECE